MSIEILYGTISFIFGLIFLKLYSERNEDNNWGLFHNVLAEMMKWEEAGAKKIMLYLGWIGIISGAMAIIYACNDGV